MQILFAVIFTFLPSLLWAASGADKCAKACVISAECGIGGLCNKGQCSYQKQFCFNERWSVNARGETTNCDGYSCSSTTGLCLREARDSTDCLSGYVFDGDTKCIPSVQCNFTEPACQDLFERWKKARSDYEATTPEPRLTPLTCVPCSDSSQCASGQMCWNNRCEAQGSYCAANGADEQFSVTPTQPSESCGNYSCERVQGKCFKSCLKNSDCRSGKLCLGGSCL